MSASSLVSQGYGGYAGWGDTEADADFRATGGAGKRTNNSGGGGGGVPQVDPVEQARKLNEFYIQQNQPYIQNLQGQIAPTQASYGSAVAQYQSQIPNLQAQYKDVLNQITKGVGQSYAARGLSNQSPQQAIDIGNAQLPAANQQTSALNQFLNAIGQLGISGQGAVNAIQTAIGQAQAGNPSLTVQAGLQSALAPYQAQQLQAQSALANAQAQAAPYVPIPSLGVYNPLNSQLLTGYGQTTFGAGNGANTIRYTG